MKPPFPPLASRLLFALFAITASILAQAQSRRPAWTTSGVNGSPEPPYPYVSERVFPHLTFDGVVELALAPGSDLIYLMELKGRVYSFANQNDTTQTNLLVDLKQLHPEMAAAYGMAFHPKFQENGYIYICYVIKDGVPDGTRVSRFTVEKSNPPRVDLKSEVVLLTFLSGGHNGGCLRFGPDGYLYISTGDAANPDPPDILNTGQDISDLLSSVLCIDVDHTENGKAYAIPASNPFVKTPGARPEVWAYGLRNPWKMSFDPFTGALWIGDVGWELWEIVYKGQRGGNYGWSLMEGPKQVVKPEGKRGPTPVLPPVMIHPHSEAASITAGHVYRGSRLKELRGAFIYGDWETGKIWALRDGVAPVQSREQIDTPYRIICFGEYPDGDQFFATWGEGTLHRLIPNPDAGQPSKFPHKLSETGIFSSVKEQTPAT
ncbi:MAG TPA: PQQ-dependent sugar dehydrogenase, partial [Verrucomicrobiae bacterium]|nr:PQQ-dependent sugar dehydrogenase [Verrucomicrobiae bacterium]